MTTPQTQSKNPAATRSLVLASAVLLLTALPSWAADPTGEWLVKEGVARIRIENCSGALWGVVSWEKKSDNPSTFDVNNPDPSKRTRPTLGMPIILEMKPTDPNMWEGSIYNSKDGKTYDASVSVKSPDVLRVEGCLLGFLCGGEDWTRVKLDAATTGAAQPGKPAVKRTKPATAAVRPAGAPAPAGTPTPATTTVASAPTTNPPGTALMSPTGTPVTSADVCASVVAAKTPPR